MNTMLGSAVRVWEYESMPDFGLVELLGVVAYVSQHIKSMTKDSTYVLIIIRHILIVRVIQ